MTRDIESRELHDILRDRLGDRRLALFLDYDGTLSSIVDHPGLAVLDDGTHRALERVAGRHPVHVISGRDLDDVRKRVAVEGIHFVGSHGFQMSDALPEVDRQTLEEAVHELESAASELEQWLDYIDGVVIERKRYSFALHYRMVDRDDLQQIRAAALDVLERYGSITSRKGKQVIEFIPDVPWDKGRCIQALIARLNDDGGGRKTYPVYIGDDLTDEDAFGMLEPDTGISVLVADDPRASAAEFRLRDVHAVREFLEELSKDPR